MSVEQIILAGFTVAGGVAGGAGAQWLRDRADVRKTVVQTTGEVHKADLESDEKFQERLIKRIEHLEERQTEHDKIVRAQAEQISNLRLLLERVGNQYEAMRRLQVRVAGQLRAGKSIDDNTLAEMESAPEVSCVLAGPESRPLPTPAPFQFEGESK